MKRLLLFLIAAGVAWYIAKSYGLFSPATPAAPQGGPVERARAAAAASNARTDAGSAVAREADQPAGGAGVTENMTPDQVRALLGSPDDVQTETTDAGMRRETWTYRSVGKTVVFENGIAVSIR
jgi:hypothetical protein